MKKGFTLYNDSLDVLDALSPEETNLLFRAIRDFNRGIEPEVEGAVKVAFVPFRNQFIRDGIGKSTVEISKINSKNRKKRNSTNSNEKKESNESNEFVQYSKSISNSKSIGNLNGGMGETEKVKEIIDYLNEKTKATFSPKTANTIRHISARFTEGRTIEDFKKVIDTKVSEWIGTEQAKYLRPDTLFGSKFEAYLNQQIIEKVKKEPIKSAWDE